MDSPLKDAAVAFGTVLTLMTVWSFVESQKAKEQSDTQIKTIHSKLDLLLKKVK